MFNRKTHIVGTLKNNKKFIPKTILHYKLRREIQKEPLKTIHTLVIILAALMINSIVRQIKIRLYLVADLILSWSCSILPHERHILLSCNAGDFANFRSRISFSYRKNRESPVRAYLRFNIDNIAFIRILSYRPQKMTFAECLAIF